MGPIGATVPVHTLQEIQDHPAQGGDEIGARVPGTMPNVYTLRDIPEQPPEAGEAGIVGRRPGAMPNVHTIDEIRDGRELIAPVHEWKTGAPLAVAAAPHLLHRQSSDKEEIVKQAIGGLVTHGRELKLKVLVIKIDRINLSREIKDEFVKWKVGFQAIDPRNEEERSIALSLLIFRVLRPALCLRPTLDDARLLLQADDDCSLIIQDLLPKGESVKVFLNKIEKRAIGDLVTHGRELQLKVLIIKIDRINVSQEIKEEFVKWKVGFQAIDPRNEEERSIALSLLIFRVLRPALCLRPTLDDARLLLQADDDCSLIIQDLLPKGESVKVFLNKIEIGLRKEILSQDQTEMIRLVEEIEKITLSMAALKIDALIEDSCTRIRERLQALQAARRAMQEVAREEVLVISQQVEELRQQVIVQSDNIERLGKQDKEATLRFKVVLDECKTLIEELS